MQPKPWSLSKKLSFAYLAVMSLVTGILILDLHFQLRSTPVPDAKAWLLMAVIGGVVLFAMAIGWSAIRHMAGQIEQSYHTERQRRDLAESLERVGRELSSSLDLREVPARVLDLLDQIVPYERGAILVQQRNQLRFAAQRGFPDDLRATNTSIPIRAGDVFQRVVESRQPVLVQDVSQDAGWLQINWLPIHHSWMGIPLIARDRVIGMISLTRQAANSFTEQDAALVSAFAGQAAIALENAELYNDVKSFSTQLEKWVEQRTEDLNKAYQVLEKLDSAKSKFIDVAAHELRTPLTVVSGYAQVLLDNPKLKEVGPEIGMYLAGILSGATRMHDIINSMLDMAKIENQTLSVTRQPVMMWHVIERVQFDFEQALQQRQIEFSSQGLKEIPPAQGDPELLHRVFYNIVANAIKYTPDQGKITVSGQKVQEGKTPMIEVIVSDTGIGIDPAYHKVIFEKFYQTGDAAIHSSGRTKFKAGGPGLGLAIARGIVLAHGGQIWVESDGYDEEKCPGSHFHVRLPI